MVVLLPMLMLMSIFCVTVSVVLMSMFVLGRMLMFVVVLTRVGFDDVDVAVGVVVERGRCWCWILMFGVGVVFFPMRVLKFVATIAATKIRLAFPTKASGGFAERIFAARVVPPLRVGGYGNIGGGGGRLA